MIALATTTITAFRAKPHDDPDEGGPRRPVFTGVRATIGLPTGSDRAAAGDAQVVDAALNCDPCDLQHEDAVRDDTTGDEYEVVWLRHRPGLGLDHVRAGLRAVEVPGA